MPLSNPFANRRIVEAVKAIREHPDAAYGIAIGLVAFATLTRWAMGDYIGAHIPFITFFPAIIIGELLSGVWPGVCASILAVLAAWYLFLPPAYSFELGDRENVEVLVPARLGEMHKADRSTFLRKPEARPMGAGRDLRARRRDGSEFPVEIGLNPVSHDGRSAVLATVIDISERNRAQQSQQARAATSATNTPPAS